MKVTGRLNGTPHNTTSTGQDAFLATHDGEQIARHAKIETLRKLVASGRYQVDSGKVASAILTKALNRRRR